MNTEESIKIVKALAEGVDPFSYEPLPSNSPLQNPTYVSALFTALRGLELLRTKEKRRSSLPQNATWTAEEDARLIVEYSQGIDPRLLAQQFGRTASSVRMRLAALGVVLDEQ